jgi:threonine/homoserine/homoserine lactone efflux protein
VLPGWAFTGAAAVVIMAPGPDLALVLRQVSRGGRRAGYATVAGLLTGGCVHATVSVLGGAAVFAARPGLFVALQWCGAVLLCYLGGRSLVGAVRTTRAPPVLTQPSPPAARQGRQDRRSLRYLQGLGGNLLNPKVGLFLLAFLPQFVPAGRPVTSTMAGLAGAYLGLAACWLCLVVEVSGRLHRRAGSRTGYGAAVEAVTGAVLIAVAAHLVTR